MLVNVSLLPTVFCRYPDGYRNSVNDLVSHIKPTLRIILIIRLIDVENLFKLKLTAIESRNKECGEAGTIKGNKN